MSPSQVTSPAQARAIVATRVILNLKTLKLFLKSNSNLRSKRRDVLELLSVEEDDIPLQKSDVVDLRLQKSGGVDLRRRKNAVDDLKHQINGRVKCREVGLKLQNDVVVNARFRRKKSDDPEAARPRRNQGRKKRSQGRVAADRDADDRDRKAQTRETSASQRSQRGTRKSEK